MNHRAYSPYRHRGHAGLRLGVLGMRRIEIGDQPAPARLTRDHASCCITIALRCGRCLNTGAIGASINVADLHAPLLIKSRVKEVEQIAANIGLAVHPDATALDWILRRRVGYTPMESSIECICNIEMPDTTEVVCCTVSGCSRTIEGHCGATCVACHCRGETNVF